MKRLLLVLALMTPAYAEPVKLIFNLQTNSPACFPGIDPAQSLGCLPKEFRQAGVLALAKSEDPTVTSFLFTVTATLTDGSTITKTEVVKRQVNSYSPVVVWLANDLADFSNVRVSVVAQKSTADLVSGTSPGIEY